MRQVLVIGMILVVCAAVWAQPTVDGVISTGEWDGFIVNDPLDQASNNVEMTRWGAQVSGSYLYWFCEIGDGKTYADFQGTVGSSLKKIYPGLWIDADASTSTYLADETVANCGDVKKEWAVNHRGIDILPELGIKGDWVNGAIYGPDGSGPNGEIYNYWGDGDDVAADPVTTVTNGSWKTAGSVLEARVSLAELDAKVQSLPDGVSVGDYMMVGVAVQGTNRDDVTYGYDVGTPTAIATGTKALIPGDFNLDGVVDVSDLGILATNYGNSSAQSWKMGDANRDALVDVSDLGVLATNYGSTAAGAPVATPEPATMSLLGVGALVLLRRRK